MNTAVDVKDGCLEGEVLLSLPNSVLNFVVEVVQLQWGLLEDLYSWRG
jgi:hypothetical protein